MKKPLAVLSSVLYMHSISQAPMDGIAGPKAALEKELTKIISLIINPEKKKRAPRERSIFAFEKAV
jgi:hypothetical protein